jgi:hypothetical protein
VRLSGLGRALLPGVADTDERRAASSVAVARTRALAGVARLLGDTLIPVRGRAVAGMKHAAPGVTRALLAAGVRRALGVECAAGDAPAAAGVRGAAGNARASPSAAAGPGRPAGTACGAGWATSSPPSSAPHSQACISELTAAAWLGPRLALLAAESDAGDAAMADAAGAGEGVVAVEAATGETVGAGEAVAPRLMAALQRLPLPAASGVALRIDTTGILTGTAAVATATAAGERDETQEVGVVAASAPLPCLRPKLKLAPAQPLPLLRAPLPLGLGAAHDAAAGGSRACAPLARLGPEEGGVGKGSSSNSDSEAPCPCAGLEGEATNHAPAAAACRVPSTSVAGPVTRAAASCAAGDVPRPRAAGERPMGVPATVDVR